MSIGERLRSMRRKNHMTLMEVSSELGVSLNSVYRWEHNLAVPRKEALNKMADIYQVPLKWLLYGVTAEDGGAMQQDDKFEQDLLAICRKLSDSSKYKVLGYAERIWIEDMSGDDATPSGSAGNGNAS